jgi:hypothetical protein
LQDIEMRIVHVGPKYLARFGQATWIGVFRDPQGRPIGPFVTKPERHYGDITPEVNKFIFHDYARSGRGPVYMDGQGMSEADYRYMMHWLVHEGNSALIEHMKAEGIDYRRHPVEFLTYDLGCQGRIVTNERAEASLKGLYALGDELANGVSNASVFGWISGENAVAYCREAADPGPADQAVVDRTVGLVASLLNRPEGAAGGRSTSPCSRSCSPPGLCAPRASWRPFSSSGPSPANGSFRTSAPATSTNWRVPGGCSTSSAWESGSIRAPWNARRPGQPLPARYPCSTPA